MGFYEHLIQIKMREIKKAEAATKKSARYL